MPTLVVLEKYEPLRSSISDWLKTQFPEYDILATNGDETVLNLVKKERPNAIIVSTGQSDSEYGRLVRTIKRVCNVPIVVLTSYSTESGRTHAYENGADAYVEKKSIITDLQQVLASLLSSKSINQ